MFYSPFLNKAASKLTTRGALQYVYQDPNTGEFVASDGKIMLIESGGTPFMNKFWDTITQMPTNCAEEYPDWRAVLLRSVENANRLWFDDKVLLQDGFAIFDRLYTSAKIYQLVKDFIGPDMIINIPVLFGDPLYFRNADKSRQALIMAYELYPETVNKAEWQILDARGTIIHTCKDIREAEIFGLTVKLAGEN
jgi:hypothetical protein